MTGKRTCLVVRPEPGCSRTAARVGALASWWGVAVPLTERRATEALRPSAAYDAIVLTSAAAAPYIAYLPQDVPVHAIGKTTATAAREAGFPSVTVGMDGIPPAHGEELGRMLAASYAGRTLLYPCSEQRRPNLERAAGAGGVRILPWPVYRTVPIANGTHHLRNALSGPPDAVMLHAPSGAAALASAWPDEWLSATPTWLCLSMPISDALPSHFRGERRIASRRDEAAIMELLMGPC